MSVMTVKTEQQVRDGRDNALRELQRVEAIYRRNPAHKAAYDRARAAYEAAQTAYMRITGPGGMTTDEFNAQQAGSAAVTAPAGVATPTAPVAVPTQADRDALAYLTDVIGELFDNPKDVRDLVQWAWDQILADANPTTILQGLRETAPYERDYGYIIDKQREAGQVPLTPAEIRAYRAERAALMRQAGIPAGFYDSREDADRDLIEGVSLSELGSRISDGYLAYMAQPEEDRAVFEAYFGPGAGVAYFLDPDKSLPALERELAAARIGGAARRTGYGELSRVEMEDLASLGVTADQAQAGFNTLATSAELFNPLPGDAGETAIDRRTQLDAVFRGNAIGQQKWNQRRQKRLGAFGGGGGFAATAEGARGLG